MKTLLIMCVLLCNIAYSQAPDKKTLIADETEIVKSGEAKFRIITTNDKIFSLVINKFKDSIMVSYNSYKRVDKRRKDTYWESSFYFNNEDYKAVVTFFKNNLR